MADSPRYPGVYVSETTAAPHVVEPATTNLTAFIGDFPKGPVGDAVLIETPEQFYDVYGKLTTSSSLAALAIGQFFLNGGIGAWVVRVGDAQPARAENLIAQVDGQDFTVTLTAANPGSWANDLSVGFEAASPDHVNLVVYPAAPNPQPLETVTIACRHADGSEITAAEFAAFINGGSDYVRADPGDVSEQLPSPSGIPMASGKLTGGEDNTLRGDALATDIKAEFADGMALTELAPQLFNLLCLPDVAAMGTDAQNGVHPYALEFCRDHGAFLIMDAPLLAKGLGDPLGDGPAGLISSTAPYHSEDDIAGAVYYPWIQITDPVTSLVRCVPPSGAIAGIFAATDVARGVWKAPAGIEAALAGVTGLADTTITDEISGELNGAGINCLRTFPLYGTVVWGARTLAGSDPVGSPFKYVPVRRLTTFIEQSLLQSLQWAQFEPNAPTLWESITLEATAFMSGLFASGAFAGATAAQAYSVVCDATTTSTNDVLNGIVNLNVGFQPVEPAEFVLLNIMLNATAPAAS